MAGWKPCHPGTLTCFVVFFEISRNLCYILNIYDKLSNSSNSIQNSFYLFKIFGMFDPKANYSTSSTTTITIIQGNLTLICYLPFLFMSLDDRNC